MRLSTPRRMGKTSYGFTIVELLIVVVVIAVLAAITIVAYNGITQRAADSATQSAASQAQKKMKEYAVLHGDALPPDLATIGMANTNGVQFQYTVNENGYCLTATTNGRGSYVADKYSYNDGTTLSQSVPVSGVCPGHSSIGGQVIKNLITNPSFETGTTGWAATNAFMATSTGVWADSGTTSVRITNSTTANQGDFRISSASASVLPFGMQPGKTYTISARLYFTAAPTGALGRAPGVLFWYSTNGSNWIEAFGPKAPTAPGTYTVSHTVTLSENVTGALIGFGVASTTSSQGFYYDSIMITEGSTVYNYGDGAKTDWVWLGAPNASASSGPAN